MKFETKGVLEIKGNFFVPDYQRGYRWGENEVKQLLEDIDENRKKNEQKNEHNNYYLQPIVLKEIGEKNYELIDGQQRLTTLYLILNCIKEVLPSTSVNYSINYATRQETQNFLRDIDLSREEENIDFLFITKAYSTIRNWFGIDNEETDSMGIAMDFYRELRKYVKIIWYEPEDNISGVELFTRLNIGRIPLTNSELVRALFLSRNSDLTPAEQLEIAAEWDSIEKELHQPSFWAFLTNYQPEDYPNRIDLLFDLMAGGKSRDKYATFFYFNNKIKEKERKQDLWKEIVAYFARLKEWYGNREIFHKVGFLVSVGNKDKALINLLNSTAGKKKDEVSVYLDSEIKKEMKEVILGELTYQSKNTHQVLLLFNVLSVMNVKDESLRFPFDKYKNNAWSLEHIHAQNAESLNTTEKRKEWLRLHKEILEEETELAKKIGNILEKDINTEQFRELQQEVFAQLSNETGGDYLDSLANMALLNVGNNAALNNSVFEVKRRKIIEMDKAGAYIPYCTRMVFFKYYTPTPSNLHSWGADDREAYIKAIGETLKPYLKTELNPESENTQA
jgi:raw score 3.25